MTSVSKKHLTHIGIMGLPLNAKGQFLLTRRNQPDIPEVHLKWQITGGGMEYGETPEQTLARELKEEISVTPQVLYPHPILKSYLWKLPTHQSHVLLACYLVDIGNQIPIADNQEIDSFQWYYPHQISSIDYLPLCDQFVFEANKIASANNLLEQLES